MTRSLRWMLVGSLLFLVGCGDDVRSAAPETTTDSTLLPPVAPTNASSSNAPRETSNPEVVSRRMTTDDVAIDLFGHGPLPASYERAAVPVDAWPAERVTVNGELFDLESREAVPATAEVLVTAEFVACELIAVWALPQPDQVAVGYEEHPGIACDVPNEFVVVFSLPRSGLNSEGSWDDVASATIELLRRVGPGAER